MKTLFLLRHSKSSHDITDLEDLLRPLNSRGYNDANKVAAYLAKLKQKPRQIITSPAIRAFTTASIFAQHLKISIEKIHLQQNLYFSGKSQIIKAIKALDNQQDNLMLVGHNPDFEDVLQAFIKSNTELMTTTGLAILTFDVKKWSDVNHSNCTLVQLISPAIINSEKELPIIAKQPLAKQQIKKD